MRGIFRASKVQPQPAPITWCHSYLVAEKRQSHFSEQLSHTHMLTLGSPLRSSHTLDTDRGSVSAHQPAVRIDSLPPLEGIVHS